MYLGASVGVVVPAYNEQAHVRAVLDSLPPLVDRAYVVDDASTDDTWAEIRRAVRNRPSGRGVVDQLRESSGLADGGVESPAATGGGESRSAGSSHEPLSTGGRGESPAATSGGEPSSATSGGETPVAASGGEPRSNGSGGDRDAATTALDAVAERTAESGGEPPVVAVRHGENRGRGAAVATGYRLALADGMDVVAVMDGDGQMDPAELARIVHPVAVGEADYAKGNRLDGPDHWAEMSRWRLFGNLVLTGLTRVASGYWGLRDPQNGYTAISGETLAALPLEDLYEDYGFLNDLLVELNLVDARVVDVPIRAVYGDEESGIRYRQFVPGVSALLARKFGRRLLVEGGRNRRPWLPGTYFASAAAWCGALLAAVAGGCPPCAETLPGSLVATLPAWPTLLVAGLVVTAAAIAVDRRQNAPLDRRAGPAPDVR